MSSLIRQSHANNDKPLWVSTSGSSVVTGDIALTGNLSAKYIEARSGFSLLDNSNPQTQVLSIADATNNPSGSPIFQVGAGGQFRFGLFSQAAANTTLTPSAPGSGLDNLTVGGVVATNKLNISTAGAGASCGTGTIPVGATNVVINTTAITASSKVFFSYVGSPSSGPGAGPSQGNLIFNSGLTVVGTSFRVDHTDATGVSTAVSNVPCTFNWMIIN